MDRSRTGKKGPYAAYYIHFQPGSCFVGRFSPGCSFLLRSLSFAFVGCACACPCLGCLCSPPPWLIPLCTGCGLWNPEAEPLALLREEMDENSSALKEVLRAPDMRREFLKGASDDDDAIVNAFTYHNRESALKTKPKVRRFLYYPTLSFSWPSSMSPETDSILPISCMPLPP